jgi:hypothetical protein
MQAARTLEEAPKGKLTPVTVLSKGSTPLFIKNICSQRHAAATVSRSTMTTHSISAASHSIHLSGSHQTSMEKSRSMQALASVDPRKALAQPQLHDLQHIWGTIALLNPVTALLTLLQHY